MAGWGLADPIIGLAISAAIINVLRVAGRDIYRRLMDRVEPGVVESIEHQLHHVEGIADVGRVRARWVGHELHADADVSVRGDLQLGATNEILDEARRRLTNSVPRLTDVLIHAAPCGWLHRQ